VREGLKVKVEVPSAESDEQDIIVTGPEADCKEAERRMREIEAAQEAFGQETVPVDLRFVPFLRGGMPSAISADCGGVTVRAPKPGKTKFEIRGRKEDVAAAKVRLLAEVAKLESGKVVELKVDPKHHPVLKGERNVRLNKLAKESEAAICFPGPGDPSDIIRMAGPAAATAKALSMLEAMVQSAENTVEREIAMAPECATALKKERRGGLLADLTSSLAVTIKLPSAEQDQCLIKGGRDEVAAAVARIESFAEDLAARVEETISVPATHHRTIIGSGGATIRAIQQECNVTVTIPKTQKSPKVKEVGVDGGDGDKAADAVRIAGRPEAVAMARERILALLPISEQIEIPSRMHGTIIGAGGESVRKLMTEFGVSIKFPQATAANPKLVKVRGPRAQVDGCLARLSERVAELEISSFEVELEVDPAVHQMLIGKQGAKIRKFRTDFEVQVDFPPTGKKKLSGAAAKRVVVSGRKEKAEAAAEALMAKVTELESLVTITIRLDPRCHRSVIGKGGEKIRALQDRFEVRVNMPRDGGDEIAISGPEARCLECKDALFDIQDKWTAQAKARDEKSAAEAAGGGRRGRDDDDGGPVDPDLAALYMKPSRFDAPEKPAKDTKRTKAKKPLQFKGAPWQDTNSFPDLGSNGGAGSGAAGFWATR